MSLLGQANYCWPLLGAALLGVTWRGPLLAYMAQMGQPLGVLGLVRLAILA